MSHYVPPTIHRYFESDRKTKVKGRLICEFLVEGKWKDWDGSWAWEEERRLLEECAGKGWWDVIILSHRRLFDEDGRIEAFVWEHLITREPPKL